MTKRKEVFVAKLRSNEYFLIDRYARKISRKFSFLKKISQKEDEMIFFASTTNKDFMLLKYEKDELKPITQKKFKNYILFPESENKNKVCLFLKDFDEKIYVFDLKRQKFVESISSIGGAKDIFIYSATYPLNENSDYIVFLDENDKVNVASFEKIILYRLDDFSRDSFLALKFDSERRFLVLSAKFDSKSLIFLFDQETDQIRKVFEFDKDVDLKTSDAEKGLSYFVYVEEKLTNSEPELFSLTILDVFDRREVDTIIETKSIIDCVKCFLIENFFSELDTFRSVRFDFNQKKKKLFSIMKIDENVKKKVSSILKKILSQRLKRKNLLSSSDREILDQTLRETAQINPDILSIVFNDLQKNSLKKLKKNTKIF